MSDGIKLLDVVALMEDLPRHALRRGQVGTIVEILAPDVFEVEFSDSAGRMYALLTLRSEQILPLIHEPVHAALESLKKCAFCELSAIFRQNRISGRGRISCNLQSCQF